MEAIDRYRYKRLNGSNFCGSTFSAVGISLTGMLVIGALIGATYYYVAAPNGK